MPDAEFMVRDFRGVGTFQDFPYAGFDCLKSFPVASRGQSIILLAVFFVRIGVPVPASDAINQNAAYLITLNRKRVVGVGDVDRIDVRQISVDIFWNRARFWKLLDNGGAHVGPHDFQSVHAWRDRFERLSHRMVVDKRIRLSDIVHCSFHGREDFVGQLAATDVAECAGEPSGGCNTTDPPLLGLPVVWVSQ